MCYHGTYHISVAVHPKTTAYCGTVGRYVIYQHITKDRVSTTNLGVSAKAQINLCEVEVFGKCCKRHFILRFSVLNALSY